MNDLARETLSSGISEKLAEPPKNWRPRRMWIISGTSQGPHEGHGKPEACR